MVWLGDMDYRVGDSGVYGGFRNDDIWRTGGVVRAWCVVCMCLVWVVPEIV